MKILNGLVAALACSTMGCASPPKPVPVGDSQTPYSTAHSQCSSEMHRSNLSGTKGYSTSGAMGGINAAGASIFAHLFQSESLGYDVYRACMFRNGWRLEKQ